MSAFSPPASELGSPLLSAASQRAFDITMGKAEETDDPVKVVEELRVSFLCDGLDSMVRAGAFASSFVVQSQNGGYKGTLTDEGFDADMFSLCNTLVSQHEKKVEKLREREREAAIAAKTKEHGAAVAALSAMADQLLTADILNDNDADDPSAPPVGGGAMGSDADDLVMNADGTLKAKPRTAMLPPLAEWTTPEQHRQAWRSRIQLLMDVPQSCLVGRFYFWFCSLVVIMSSLTSVLETLPIVNPQVRPQYFVLWNSLEWFATIIFTLDFLIRAAMYTWDSSLPTSRVQNFISFMRSPINIIDFITLLPQFIQPVITGRIILGNLRTLRLLRLYKVVRRFQGFHRLSLALRSSLSALIGPFAFLAACVFFLSAVLFAAERGDFDVQRDAFMLPDPACDNQPVSFLSSPTSPAPPGSLCPAKVASKFVSQWQAFWWCVVTMCTVGYGDFVPVTWVGRLVATITVIVGMVFIAMPIAVIGTNYTMAVQMTSKSDEADKEDAIQRQDQRGTELSGGMAHPGARLLKLLGELLGDPSNTSMLSSANMGSGSAAAGGGGAASPDRGGAGSAGSGGRSACMLDLCAPSLNDLNIIEAVLESVVMAMLDNRSDASLPLWMARWPSAVRETSRRTEAVYRTAVISRPLVVHVGSQGKHVDGHASVFSHSLDDTPATSAAGTPTTTAAAAKEREKKQHAAAATMQLGRGAKQIAANNVLSTALTFPREGSSIPHVCIYDPEVRRTLEQAALTARRQKEEARLHGPIGPILADKSNNPTTKDGVAIGVGARLKLEEGNIRPDTDNDDDVAPKPLPTVLNHHATMCCMRIWGEPTFLLFSGASPKESTTRSTASKGPIAPLNASLLKQQVRGSLHDLFRRQLVQSPRSLRRDLGAGLASSGSGESDVAAAASQDSAGDGAKRDDAKNQGGSGAGQLTADDLAIESVVFRHSVHKRQQWLNLELKPVRVRHGDILSFGAAQAPDSEPSFLDYRFEDNSGGAF